MRKRKTFIIGAAALVIASGVSVGAYTAVNAQPNEGTQLPTAEDVAVKLNAINNVGPAARGQASAVSGSGPVPQILDSQDELFQDTVITNTVVGVEEDGPNRAVATRTIEYLLPNGESVQTDPGTVPFVLESDGQWRVDREYLCRQVRMIENINRQDGFDVEPDPGCS